MPFDYYSDYNDNSKDYFKDVDRIQSHRPTDESLFFVIPLSFYAHPEGCLMINYLFLVHFAELSFIRSLFWILSNLVSIGLIFVSNCF